MAGHWERGKTEEGPCQVLDHFPPGQPGHQPWQVGSSLSPGLEVQLLSGDLPIHKSRHLKSETGNRLFPRVLIKTNNIVKCQPVWKVCGMERRLPRWLFKSVRICLAEHFLINTLS